MSRKAKKARIAKISRVTENARIGLKTVCVLKKQNDHASLPSKGDRRLHKRKTGLAEMSRKAEKARIAKISRVTENARIDKM